MKGRWIAAGAIALFLAAVRLLADAIIPPRLTWWFTPAVAMTASLVTSVFWILPSRRGEVR